MRRLKVMPFLLLAGAITATPAAAEPVRLSGSGSGSAVSADTFYWVFSPGSRAWSPICPCTGASIVGGAKVSGGARLAAASSVSITGSGAFALDVRTDHTRRNEKHKVHYTSWGTTAVWNNGNGNVLFSHGIAGWGSPGFEESARVLIPGFARRLQQGGPSSAPVPEPATLLLLGAGLTAAGWRKFGKQNA